MGSLFWGGLLVVIGLQLLLNALFGLDLPLLRVAFGLVILYWGLGLIFGNHHLFKWSYDWHYKSILYNAHNSSSSTIFNTQKIDLTTLDYSISRTVSSHQTVFGTTYIDIPYDVPVLINAQATFGTIRLPNNVILRSGAQNFQNYTGDQEPLLILNVSVVFGTVVINFV